MGIDYGRMARTNPAGDRNYPRQGRYVMRIKRIFNKETREKGDMVFIELQTLAVLDASLASGEEKGPMRPGEEVAWSFKLSLDASWANLKRIFLTLLTGLTEGGEVTEAMIDGDFFKEVLSDNQPFAGVIIDVEYKQIKTVKNGTNFTVGTVKRVLKPDVARAAIGEEGMQRLTKLGIAI